MSGYFYFMRYKVIYNCFSRSHFIRTATSLQQLFFQNNNFFRAKVLRSSYFLRIGCSLVQLLFEKVSFLVEELVQNKDIYRGATFSKQVNVHSINVFGTALRKRFFSEQLLFGKIPHHLLFLKSYFFRMAFFKKRLSVAVTFLEGLLFHKILFQKL